MGRNSISGTSGSHHRRIRKKSPPGLRVVERDGHWHVYGTARVGGRSIRVRRGTGLPARDELWEAADKIRRDIENEICAEVVYGVRPSRPVAIAAREYLGLNDHGEPKPNSRAERLDAKSIAVIQEVVAKFGKRLLNEITPTDWRKYLDDRHAGNLPESRQRHINAIRPFLKWCAHDDRRYINEVPDLTDPDATKRQSRRQAPAARRRVADLRPDLLNFVFDHAHISLRAQLYTEWSTGGRVSSILFGCKVEDLVLTKNRCQITFHDTKNGDEVVAILHPGTIDVLTEYLQWRGGLHKRKEPLFLTYKRKPYSDKGRKRGWSGFNKTAFNAMKRRAIYALLRKSVRARRAGEVERADEIRADARLVRKFTQHWLRHWFATYARAMGMPRAMVKAQGGWRDDRSVERYEHDVEEMRQRMIAVMPIGGASLTREDQNLHKAIDIKRKM